MSDDSTGDAPETRRRVRTRTAQEPEAAEDGGQRSGAPRRRTRNRATAGSAPRQASRDTTAKPPTPDASTAAEEPAITAPADSAPAAPDPADSAPADSDPGTSDPAAATTGETDAADPAERRQHRQPGAGTSRSARRRRSRRRRARRQREESPVAAPDTSAEEAAGEAARAPTGASPATTSPGRSRSGSRGRGRRGARSTSAPSRSRRSVAGVSEETRRAIAEGPPRRMLVTARTDRTEIAVLEDRDLVEHYVTRTEDASYVGNVYLGRVQNVLPGMEAAFVDIGKGRNGVLYAGEVVYDPEDLDGEVPRIEQTLKPGQTVLVQVTKDPMGTKGARLTQHLSFAGRYCVLAPGDGMLGISRKLPDDERERLRKILKSVRPDGYGLIVRTAAEGATEAQLEADVARLTRIWDSAQERIATAKPLEPVYEEPSLIMRVIRDVYGPEYTDLVIDSPQLVEQVRAYLADVSPEMVETVRAHSGDDLFASYEVTTQVRRALERKVWLASGGYLIIEKTEAMWVIDVNTGRFVGKSNLEETVLRNNLEAADEIARQLRLRDMGGIIVIDFVDMMQPANRDEVLKRFKRELARDKTKSRVMEISKLGLVQMTRKNVSQGLTETFTTTCECCDGRGATISDELTVR